MHLDKFLSSRALSLSYAFDYEFAKDLRATGWKLPHHLLLPLGMKLHLPVRFAVGIVGSLVFHFVWLRM